MIVARAVAVACLTVLKWMLWLVAVLLLVLVGVQYLRGDEGAQPLAQGMGAAVAAIIGWVSGTLAARFQRGH